MKNIVITALIVSAFGITLYMDTHNGQLPWDNKKQISYSSNYYKLKNKNYRQIQKRKHIRRNSNRDHYRYDNINACSLLQSKYFNNLRNGWFDYSRNLPNNVKENARIKVNIAPNGNIISTTLVQSSGSNIIDNAALEYINSQAPFKNFSNECKNIKHISGYFNINKGLFAVSTYLILNNNR